MSYIFASGKCLVVTISGPGKFYLLSYQSNAKMTNVQGTIDITGTGVTRIMVSHSYTFERFAFYFDGAGEAVYGIGAGLARLPVGKSLKEASTVAWGQGTVGTGDVSSQATSAARVDNLITAFIIPEKI
jgi:hypothetical protein